MKLRFENIFEAILEDAASAKDALTKANLLSAVRDLMAVCQWDQEGKIGVSIDENTIVITRAGIKPKYTLSELLERCDDKFSGTDE